MTEHDRRILRPKTKPADDREALAEFHRTHWFCQACGRPGAGGGFDGLTAHHIIGGRGGRSDESANLLYLCWEPCHMLAEGLDVRQDVTYFVCGQPVQRDRSPLLPKITLGIALAMKIRAGELVAPYVERSPARMSTAALESGAAEELMTSPEWERLTALHGRTLPDLAEIPQFFVDLYRRSRPELNK